MRAPLLICVALVCTCVTLSSCSTHDTATSTTDHAACDGKCVFSAAADGASAASELESTNASDVIALEKVGAMLVACGDNGKAAAIAQKLGSAIRLRINSRVRSKPFIAGEHSVLQHNIASAVFVESVKARGGSYGQGVADTLRFLFDQDKALRDSICRFANESADEDLFGKPAH